MSRSASRRLGQIAAYLAAPLWTLQAPIWMAAPKVQEQTVPYRFTNPVLFELFWLSIAGAVAFSAAAARPITRQVGVPVRGCLGRPPPSLSSPWLWPPPPPCVSL